MRGWESLHVVLLHLGKEIYLLNKDREFFQPAKEILTGDVLVVQKGVNNNREKCRVSHWTVFSKGRGVHTIHKSIHASN